MARGWWVWFTGDRFTPDRLNAFQSAYKPSDEVVTNSATLQLDDNLVFDIDANQTWGFQFLLMYTGTNTTQDGVFGVAIPGSTTMDWAVMGFNTTDSYRADGQTGATSASSTGLGTATSMRMAILQGTVTTGGTAGTVNLQYAQASAAASTNLTVKRGSNMFAWRVA